MFVFVNVLVTIGVCFTYKGVLGNDQALTNDLLTSYTSDIGPHFIRFDGEGIRRDTYVDSFWETVHERIPGAITRIVSCSLFVSEFCSFLSSTSGAAYWNGESLQWFNEFKHINVLMYWMEHIVGLPNDGRQSHRNFDRIYKQNLWQHRNCHNNSSESCSLSGTGSTLKENSAYIWTLSGMISDLGIRSIVEVGCGVFDVMKHVDLSGATYHGWDVSEVAIEHARRQTISSNVTFSVSGIEQQYGFADLLILKDVLQHLPIQEIKVILSQLHKYKYAVITNDVLKNQSNVDIDAMLNIPLSPGGYRSLDVQQSPFNLICNYSPKLHDTKLYKGAEKITCIIAVEPSS